MAARPVRICTAAASRAGPGSHRQAAAGCRFDLPYKSVKKPAVTDGNITDGSDIKIVCDHLLPGQEIQFNADLTSGIREIRMESSAATTYYGLTGQRSFHPVRGIYIERNGQSVRKVVRR